jgi:DNA invertase Pin-like site-specific DNA recombinase
MSRKVVAIVEAGGKVGYARVSSEDQNLDMQIDAMTKTGCEKIFADKFTGSTAKRVQLQRALAYLERGDTLVIWKFDRLARSLVDLLNIFADLHARGIQIHSLTENIDTSSPGGKFYFQMLGAVAEFQRAVIRENQKAGIIAAKRRGKHLGRPRKITPEQLTHARGLIDAGTPVSQAAELFKVDRATMHRALQRSAARAISTDQ